MIVRPVLCRPFVGRRAELAYLKERRLEAGASRGGLVFVAGDAGLGKSRLVDEFCRSLAYSRWRICAGAVPQEFGGRPYGPLLDALSMVDPGAARVTLRLESKRQYFEDIVDRFAAIAARKALVVVIEDLHWGDAATLDLLAYFGSRIGRMRILLLASFRPDDLHAGHPAAAAIEKVDRSLRPRGSHRLDGAAGPGAANVHRRSAFRDFRWTPSAAGRSRLQAKAIRFSPKSC